MCDGSRLVMEDRDPHAQVKKITLQEAREIGFISSSRPLGYHRMIGSPLPDKLLPHDGLFTGRKVINVALVADSMTRLKHLAQSIKTDPAHPYHLQATTDRPRAFIQFLHREDPELTDNQQCFYLSGTDARTFAAAQTGIGRYACMVAPQRKSREACRRVAKILGIGVPGRASPLKTWCERLERRVRRRLTRAEPFAFVVEDQKLYNWAAASWAQSGAGPD